MDKLRTEKPRALLNLNPNGKVPTLSDGDIALYESCAIVHYLLDHYDFDRRGPSIYEIRLFLPAPFLLNLHKVHK